MPAADSPPFDPFNDRLSRDLRNDLSEALLDALVQGQLDPVREMAAGYRIRPELGKERRRYLEERLACYETVLLQLRQNSAPGLAPLLLWDHELFFEFHELLEKSWMRATGTEKEILQGLIRAAGTYIHHRYGHTEGAKKMAARAAATIAKHRRELPGGFSAEPLLAGLADPAAPPPRFGPAMPAGSCRHASGDDRETP